MVHTYTTRLMRGLYLIGRKQQSLPLRRVICMCTIFNVVHGDSHGFCSPFYKLGECLNKGMPYMFAWPACRGGAFVSALSHISADYFH